MTFKQKIDKILKTNKLGVNTVNGMENFVRVGRGAIKKPYDLNQEAGPKVVKKIKETFGISDEQWESGNFILPTHKSHFWDQIKEGNYIGMHDRVWAQVELDLATYRSTITTLSNSLSDAVTKLTR